MSTYALGMKSGNFIFDNFGSPAEPFLIAVTAGTHEAVFLSPAYYIDALPHLMHYMYMARFGFNLKNVCSKLTVV